MTKTSPRYAGAMAVALLVAFVLGAMNLVMGDLNQDEGWYLYAAQRVAEGWLPYRDFAFTQGPVMPMVYSLFAPVIDAAGVGGGRIITWMFGLLTALIGWDMARRLGGPAAGVIALILILVNVYQSYFTTVVKTYSLCAFFIAVGFYALTLWSGKRHAGWLILSGIALAAAAGTRISSGILLPLVGCWFLFQLGRLGGASWFWFGLGGGITLILIFGRFFWLAPEGLHFGLVEYHTLRESGSILSSMVLKAGFFSRLVQAYFVAASLLALMIAVKIWRPFLGRNTGYHDTIAFSIVRLMGWGVVLVTLVHLSAPFPYDDYQVPVFPILAIALAVSWTFAIRSWSGSQTSDDPKLMSWFVWCVLLISVAASFSSPINMDWMIAGRDRIWWKMKDKPSLLLLRDVAAEVRRHNDGSELLTQDTYLAVEAGRKVPRGWEMGPFSYYPDMTDEKADALHLMNRKKLLDTMANTRANVAAISGYSLAIASPAVMPLDPAHQAELQQALESRYEWTSDVPMFGQANTVLRLYRLRDVAEATP